MILEGRTPVILRTMNRPATRRMTIPSRARPMRTPAATAAAGNPGAAALRPATTPGPGVPPNKRARPEAKAALAVPARKAAIHRSPTRTAVPAVPAAAATGVGIPPHRKAARAATRLRAGVCPATRRKEAPAVRVANRRSTAAAKAISKRALSRSMTARRSRRPWNTCGDLSRPQRERAAGNPTARRPAVRRTTPRDKA